MTTIYIAFVENKEPPKNKHRLLQDKPTKLEYSAIKIRLNYRPGYSVLLPATNSASASDKSNGALFVSAIIIIIKISSSENIP